MLQDKKWIGIASAAVVIGFAAYFRLWNLPERGLYYFDEAMFLSNGRYFGGLLRLAFAQLLQGGLDMTALLERAHTLWDSGGSPWLHARPLHEGGLIAAVFLFGDAPVMGQGLSALTGIASVALLLGAAPGKTGIMAAAMMALSLWHAHYSRCGLSQALSLLPVCAVLFLMGKGDPPSTRRMALSGLLAGLAFAAHYNLFWFPPLLWVWSVATGWKSKTSIREWAQKISVLSLCMAIPPALIQAATWIVKRVLTGMGSGAGGPLDQIETYFQQLYSQLFFWDGAPRHMLSPLFLPKVLYSLENPAFATLLLAGFGWLAWQTWKHPGMHRFWFCLALIPYATWTFFGFPGPRSFLPLLPALCLGGAGIMDAAITRWGGQDRKVEGIFALCLILLFTFQVSRLWILARAVSPWKIAADGIVERQRSHGGIIADADLGGYQRGILRYHLGNKVDRIATKGDFLLWDATRLDRRWNPHAELDSIRRASQPFLTFTADIGHGMILQDAFEPGFTGDYQAGIFPREFALYEVRDEAGLP